MTVVRNGRVLDIKGHRAPSADILIAGDEIAVAQWVLCMADAAPECPLAP
jgi:hypothetical protein